MTVSLDALRGRSPRIEAIRRQVTQLLARQAGARRPPPALILGETGTGKGLLARLFHQAGPRPDGPFVDINCAAIPETLLEAELFGYERGAFTDARHAKPGLFQTAHRGTLFLDEIGLLPASLQGKLLGVLEDRVVRRLGSTRTEAVDVVLVAATGVDLRRAVADGRFRGDLYHRLAVITLELPPLRARGTDILDLAEHFLARACADYGLSARQLTPDARDVLMAYQWPGNVRELANTMERVALLSDRDEITAAMLDFRGGHEAAEGDAGSLEHTLRARIETALRANSGNIRRTAASLGISRNTLRARMDKYGLRGHRAARAPIPLSAPSATSPVWVRRHLSFLRVKLVAWSAADSVRALEAVGEKVRAFGGWIEERSPQDIIAVFGLEPLDNAPSHAALAALAIQNAATRAHSTGRGGDVVSAIHCADHLVTHRGATPVIGVDGKATTWSILETMVAAAPSGTVIVSKPVAPFLARRFALEPAPGELDAVLVLRMEDTAAGWNATPFVGRTAELHALRHAASFAEQRHGQIVGIVGEAGVGKSRLVHETIQHLDGWRVLSSAGASFMKDTPYFPVIELLKSFCHVQESDSTSEIRQRVASVLPGDVDHSILTPILDLLRVLPRNDAFRDVDVEQRRKRTHDAVRQMFLAASMAQPVCLIVEDLHWIDSETRAVLDDLVNSIARSRILLIVNYRPEYQHPWGTKTYYSQVRLDTLPIDSAREFLDVLLGSDAGLAPLKHLLVKRGNPFFLEETVRMLVETNALAGERGRYRLTHPVQAIEVPPTVHAMLAARIDRLPAEDRYLLQVSAVIGKNVALPLLAGVVELPDETIRRGLERLKAAEFVYETKLSPHLEYTFKHTLTHDVAYETVLPPQRLTLHAKIVQVIERQFSDRLVEQVERLADHAVRGEVWDKAFAYGREAGARAAERSAHREAVAHFERALAVLERLPKTVELREAAIDLRFASRSSLLPLGEVDRILEHLRAAETLAHGLGDQRRFGWVSAYMTVHFSMIGQNDQSLVAGRRAVDIAAVVDDAPLQIVARNYLGQAEGRAGNYRVAADRLRSSIAAVKGDMVRDRLGQAALPAVYSRTLLASALAELGEFAEGAARGAEAIQIAETLDHPFSLGLAFHGTGRLHLSQGEVDKAITVLERGHELCRARSVGYWLPVIRASLGLAYATAGRCADAVPLVEQALERVRSVQMIAYQSLLLTSISETMLLAGRTAEANASAEEALRISCDRGERGMEAHALRLLAEIGLCRDPLDTAPAEHRYQEALARAVDLGMLPLVAHCQLGLGRLRRRAGKREPAQEHLGIAITMYREMDMQLWLERATAELAGL